MPDRLSVHDRVQVLDYLSQIAFYLNRLATWLAEHDAFTEFDAAFNARAAADQARQDAISAALVEDMMHPARRDEDRMARIMHRAADGVYDGQPALSFASESAAIELAAATGRGLCGPVDEFGRCASRYHDLECAHGHGVDWMASGPPRQTYDNALTNWADSINLGGTPTAIYDDPDDPLGPAGVIPQATLEFAHQLANEWGLDDGVPGSPDPYASMDLLRPQVPQSPYDQVAASIGAPARDGQPVLPGYPGISDLARDLGLK